MAFTVKTILFFGFVCLINVALIVGNYTEVISFPHRLIHPMRGLANNTHQSFLGIPYAEAPIGVLRFKNPMPFQWKNSTKNPLYNATVERKCMQMNFLVPNVTLSGSEDCLYLNIYRPNIIYTNDTKLDVMVYIHSGGFFAGPVDPNFSGTTYFMKKKSVILVTIQYRLSVLGFLSTGDVECPGNFGLKDQVLALKWINENIQAFGGNPDSITIFGHGTGAASVHMHMLSPLSRVLFTKAIAMSGNAIGPYNYPTQNPLELARRQAKAVGIKEVDSLSSKDLVEKLREIKAEDLILSVTQLKTFGVNPSILYRTVVEPKILTDAFLTEDPRVLIERGEIANVPFMTGVLDGEGAVRAVAAMHSANQLKETNNRVDELLPELLQINIKGLKRESFTRKLKQRYLNGGNVFNLADFIKIFTDYTFYYPLFKSLPHMINRMPVYLFKYSYHDKYTYCTLKYSYEGADSVYRFVNGFNLTYLVRIHFRLNRNDKWVSQKLAQTFTAFAGSEFYLPNCDVRMHKDKDKIDPIDNQKRTDEFYTEMVKFWDELGDHLPYFERKDGSYIRGLVGETYQSFLGIPYAEPPIGNLRFVNPVPIRKFNYFNADKNPEMCIQMNYLIPNPVLSGSEDCLYLNIFRPTIGYNESTKLDVMVYIHGGGFFSGSIDPSITGPKYFMKQKSVILVMIQYRLSVLGFLSTGDEECPGNFGLKDQAMALKWVKYNIETFGGNPKSITIFGHGTGAASVHMHMMSPLSQNLFHKVVAMSGSAIGPYNYPTPNPIELARNQAEVMGIRDVDSLSSKDLVEKLREFKAEDLILDVTKLKTFDVESSTFYRTVVEPNIRGAFLTEDPRVVLKRGDFVKVPFMTGFVDVDGAVRAAAIMHNATQLKAINERMGDLLPVLLELNIEGYKKDTFIRRLKNYYLKESNVINKSNKAMFLKIFTDYAFIYPMYKSLLYMSNSTPCYMYRFSYRGEYSNYVIYTHNYTLKVGPVHGDDLIYLFDAPERFLKGLTKKSDQIARRELLQTFTAFAKYEDPQKHNLQRCNSYEMHPICKFTRFYKNNTEFATEIKTHLRPGMIKFWNEFSDLE